MPTPVIVAKGLDYAAARPDPAAIAAAGYQFVIRYLSDGGPSLPGKLLTPAEADGLRAHGIEIVSNWETTADRMLGGYAAGIRDAQLAAEQISACGGRADRPIYFSADFDATEAQQQLIDAYLRGAATVIGAEQVGIYAGYWPLSRALDAGTAVWGWQTEAWSGANRDPRAHLVQRNRLGYAYVGGVQCDINEARRPDYGQWNHQEDNSMPIPDAVPLSVSEQRELLDGVRWLREQLGPNQWSAASSLGVNTDGEELTVRDGLAAMRRDITDIKEITRS